MFAALSHAPGIFSQPPARPGLPTILRRGLAVLAAWTGLQGYRPEKHYMRGGNTQGSRSLAAARRRIAGQA
ncbi:hypothetical protein [Roseicella aerolata]|uniref:Uncharacterized protein n=1 Tax=Roseicella aerolata TaxID=2883479 RepID=A0A9X1IDK0_9PROT|nr:hypothetical protein [Roseicella aerolata]MCB4822801.1 hypothetical protein [Roseicella aerolata]